jgi:hypothetical protein
VEQATVIRVVEDGCGCSEKNSEGEARVGGRASLYVLVTAPADSNLDFCARTNSHSLW